MIKYHHAMDRGYHFEASQIVEVQPNPEGGAILVLSDHIPVEVNDDYIRKHRPKEKGWYLVLRNGFETYATESAFERNYLPV